MIDNQRIFYNKNGTEIDISQEVSDYRNGSYTIPFVSAQDKIYIASDLPFNHKYFLFNTVNDVSSSLSVDIWHNDEWQSVVDLIDRTSENSVSWSKSELIRWTTNRDEGWDVEQDSEDVTGISKVGIYNSYWIRLSFSADLKATTELKYVGYRFSDDDMLYTYYGDLDSNALRTSINSSWTDWNEMNIAASEVLIRELQQKNIIKTAAQILDYSKMSLPAVHKTAELIYGNMGSAYEDKRKLALEQYNKFLKMKYFSVDKNADANLSSTEKRHRVGFLSR